MNALLSSSSLTFNVTRTKSANDNTLFTALRRFTFIKTTYVYYNNFVYIHWPDALRGVPTLYISLQFTKAAHDLTQKTIARLQSLASCVGWWNKLFTINYPFTLDLIIYFLSHNMISNLINLLRLISWIVLLVGYLKRIKGMMLMYCILTFQKRSIRLCILRLF